MAWFPRNAPADAHCINSGCGHSKSRSPPLCLAFNQGTSVRLQIVDSGREMASLVRGATAPNYMCISL